MTINIIQSFQNIILPNNKKTIIVCDIDFTFIRPISTYHFYYLMFKDNLFINSYLDKYIKYLLIKDIDDGYICQTDPVGFNNLLVYVNQNKGKFLFLTSRNYNSHPKTLYHLAKVNLINPINYEIHYTNNLMQKGDYIKKYILNNNFEHYIFIDDCVNTINYTASILPNFNCYLFRYPDNNI